MAFGVLEIARLIQARIINGEVLGEEWIQGVRVNHPAALGRDAKQNSIAFFFSKKFEEKLLESHPSILVTHEKFVEALQASAARLPFWKTTVILACEDPYFAMAILSEKFAALLSSVSHVEAPLKTTIHPTAIIHPSVEMGVNVEIGPHVVLEESVKIGSGTVISAGCYFGRSVQVGERCVFFPRVTLYERTQIGDRVRVHSGVVIGADGFGYAPRNISGSSSEQEVLVGGQKSKIIGHQKIYHFGRVVIGNDVEIGANTCIDRGTFSDTVIGDEVKIDNQVQVGHNVQLGRGTIVCGCVGFAGSSSTGEFVYVGGLTGISNQVHIGDHALVGGGTIITKDVPPHSRAVGNPQRDYHSHFKVHALLNRLISESRGKKP